MTVRRGRRRKQLIDILEENIEHWKLQEEAPDRTVRRICFEWCCGPVVRHTAE